MASRWCRHYGNLKLPASLSWRRRITTSRAFSSTRPLSSNYAWTLVQTATGCGKCVPGSSIARICMSVCAARQIALSARISLCRRMATAVARNCKAGSNRPNLLRLLRRRHHRRCLLPVRHYWMSTYCNGCISRDIYGVATASGGAFRGRYAGGIH